MRNVHLFIILSLSFSIGFSNYAFSVNRPFCKAFKDSKLESAILSTLSISNISSDYHELEKLKYLSLSSYDIRDLTGLDKCRNLEDLFLSNNYINDLRPISSLDKLKNLDLSSNEINDISPLKSLHNLEFLLIDNNNITDLKPISNLHKLKYLSIANNYLHNYQAIFECTSLIQVDLSGNDISEIFVIPSYMTQLESVNMYNNEITEIHSYLLIQNKIKENIIILNLYDNLISGEEENEIQELALNCGIKLLFNNLTNLDEIIENKLDINNNYNDKYLDNIYELELSSPKILNIDLLKKCVNLKKLVINCDIINNDLDYLSDLSNVEDLSLYSFKGNTVKSLEKLKYLNKLTVLTEYQDRINGFDGLDKLEYLKIIGNKIKELNGLNNQDQLLTIEIQSPYLNNIKFLRKIAKIKNISLTTIGRNANYSVINELNELENLTINYSVIKNIDFISNLKKLQCLNLLGCNITDLDSFNTKSKLKYLILSENRIEDIGKLVYLDVFSENATINLYSNPLNQNTIYKDIPLLESRGIKVNYDK